MNTLSLQHHGDSHSLPLVFIHFGNNYDVLEKSVKIGLFFGNEVHVITDNPGIFHQYRHCTTYNILDYLSGVDSFRKNYVHFSTNGEEIEIFCFTRWIILLNFFDKHRITNAVYLDSDVFLLGKFFQSKFEPIDGSLINFSGHTNFISLSLLSSFVEFLFTTYKDRKKLFLYIQHFYAYALRGSNEGVSDMLLLEYFFRSSQHQFNWLDLTRPILLDGRLSYFDHNLGCADGFEFSASKTKNLVFSNADSAFISKYREKYQVRMLSIHFQGPNKVFMQAYFDFIHAHFPQHYS